MKLMIIILDSRKMSEEPVHEWINIGYLVSSVKELDWLETKVNICYIDEEQCLNTILQSINDEKPDVVGFSVYQYNVEFFQRAVKKIKEYHVDISIIAGNVEMSFFPEYYLEKLPELDIVLVDEGEETLLELMKVIKDGKDLGSCRGILFRKNGKIIKSGNRPLIEDLDKLEFPDKSFYSPPLMTHFLICSRGCTGHCTFCSYKKGNVRRRSFNNILKEIREVQEQYGAKYFHILDGAFGDGEKDLAVYYRQFYEEIVKSKLQFCFSFYMRAEQVSEAVTDELIKLSKIGLDYVMIGIESGNCEDLKIYGKNAKLEDNIRALKLLNAAGISVDSGCIMFNPYSTKEKLIQNIEFIKEYDIFVNASRLASRLAVYSGTPLVKMLVHDGLLNQSGEEPISNGYNYQFQESGMEELWHLFNEIDERIQQKSHMNFYKGQMTSVKILNHLYGIDCTELIESLQSYKKFCMDYFYQLFYYVLENYNVSGFYRSVMEQTDEFIGKIVELEVEIERAKFITMRKVMRNKI